MAIFLRDVQKFSILILGNVQMFRFLCLSQRCLIVQGIHYSYSQIYLTYMFSCSEYYSYSQRCQVVQSIILILKEVQMFRAFFFSQRWLVVQSIILISRDVKLFRVLFSYPQRCLDIQSIILILREGRVRSLHTLYTLCDTLSPHPPLVIMMIMIIMRMLLITMMRTKDMIP